MRFIFLMHSLSGLLLSMKMFLFRPGNIFSGIVIASPLSEVIDSTQKYPFSSVSPCNTTVVPANEHRKASFCGNIPALYITYCSLLSSHLICATSPCDFEPSSTTSTIILPLIVSRLLFFYRLTITIGLHRTPHRNVFLAHMMRHIPDTHSQIYL